MEVTENNQIIENAISSVREFTKISIAVSVAIAAISWKFFEQPLNRLKHRFS